MLPHPDRLFPTEPAVRKVAGALYDQVACLPLISPHGHVDAAVLANDEPYPDPVTLLVRPDHYVLRLLHAQGVPLTDLGISRLARGPGSASVEPEAPVAAEGPVVAESPVAAEGPVAEPREVWRQLCRHWPAFRGTVMRLWLEDELSGLFGVDEPLTEPRANEIYDQVAERLSAPEMRPRALYRRFGLEVLATTDSPLDDLAAHKALLDDPSWEGRVLPTFRPDALIDPARSGQWASLVDHLEVVSGTSTATYRGYIAALESRRAAFKSLGATATDHGPLSAQALDLGEREASRTYDRLRMGSQGPGDAESFGAHMLMEMARMSVDDGLVTDVVVDQSGRPVDRQPRLRCRQHRRLPIVGLSQVHHVGPHLSPVLRRPDGIR